MKPAPSQPAERIGRRIGIALFWAMAVFVIVASTRSVVAQLYGGPDSPALGAPEEEQYCARELRNLERGLLERAGRELQSSRDPNRLAQWLASWDNRHALLQGRCGSLEPTLHTLFTLRRNVEQLLHDHDRVGRPLTERIDRALHRFEHRPSPP